MAIRIQLRRDTAANWVSSNPTLRAGEVGIETDTLKFKIGNGSQTWTQITNYANVTSTGLSNSLNDYILASTLGTPNGPAKLNASGEILVPEDTIIFWNDDEYTYTTKITATEPTANRVITIPNATGTVVLQDSTDTLTNKTITSPTVSGLYLSDSSIVFEGTANGHETTLQVTDPTADRTITLPDVTGTVVTTGDTGTVTNTMLAGSIANNKLANSSITINGFAIALGGEASYSTDNISQGTTNKYFSDELAQDAVAAALAAGTHTNISVAYDDNANSISLTGAVTYTDENARDAVAGLITGATHSGISVAYTDDNSNAGTLAFTNTGVTSLAGTSNQITASGSTGAVTLSLPNSLITPGNLSVTGSATIDGNLTVHGTTLTVNSQTLEVQDNLIYLNAPKEAIITNASGNGTLITYTADNTFVDGEYVTVLGVTPSGFNISGTVVQRNNNQFKIASSFQDTYVSGGTAYSRIGANPDLGFAGGYNDGSYKHSGLFRDASDNGTYKFFQGYTPEPDADIYIDTTHASFSLAPLAASTVTATTFTGNLTGNVTGNVTGDVSGNAGTVTNGVVTTGTYSNPSWITALGWSKISSTPTTLAGYGITDALASSTAASTYLTQSNAASTYAPINNPIFTGTVGGITKSMVGLGNVENTALSTWAGSTSITTLGTIATGTWSATAIGPTKGGTGLTSYASGDILYASATDTLAKLAKGTDGQILTLASGVPSWAAAPITLPSQTGESGKYLTTDGTTASWGTLVVPITTGTATVTANTATTIDTTALSGFTSIEYMVSLKQGSKVRTSKVVVQTDGTSVDMTEFAITETGGTISGVVVSAAVSSTNGVLQVTATDAATTNVDVKFSKVKL